MGKMYLLEYGKVELDNFLNCQMSVIDIYQMSVIYISIMTI